MAEDNIEVNEEEITSYIFACCEKLESGLIQTSSLIKFIISASNKTDDPEFHQRLLEHFDSSGQNVSLDFDEFQERMASFIKSAKNDGSFITKEMDVVEETPCACSSRIESPNCSTFSSSSISSNMSMEQSMKEEDISAKLDHYKSFSAKLSSDKVHLLNRINMAEDHIVQLQVDNKNLNDSLRNLEATNESLQQKAMDVEDMRSKLIQYQEQLLECEDAIGRLEQTNQRIKSEAVEARSRVNTILKERDEIEDMNHCLTLKIEELNEEKSKCEKNLDLYKMLYIQKSNECEEESRRRKEASERVEFLSMQSDEFHSKLLETEDKLREKELELNAYIHQSSLGSIDEEDLTMKLISKNYKSSFLFKNKPSLCQELQSSLIGSPVFPTPIRDLELQRLLIESSGIDFNLDDSFDPSDPTSQSVCRDEELRELNTNFLNLKRTAFLEDLSNLVTESDSVVLDKKMKSLADEYIGIIQTKISADLSCLNLKTRISQQSETIENLQQEIFELNEKITDVEDQLSTAKESTAGIKKDLDFEQMEEAHKREYALDDAGLESGIENSSKSSGDSDLKQMEEKDRAIVNLESTVSVLEADLERQVALNRSLEVEKELLAEQLKRFLDLEGETGMETIQKHLDYNNDQAHESDHSNTQVTYLTIANTEGWASDPFNRVMASGDSKDVTLYAPNNVHSPEVRSNDQKLFVKSDTQVNSIHHLCQRRIPMGSSSIWLWGLLIGLITVTAFVLGDGNLTALVNIASDLLPRPELRHVSTPPI